MRRFLAGCIQCLAGSGLASYQMPCPLDNRHEQLSRRARGPCKTFTSKFLPFVSFIPQALFEFHSTTSCSRSPRCRRDAKFLVSSFWYLG
jgi:hypothetical protein